jgi:capsid portal protein
LLFHALPSENIYGIPRWISQTPNILGSREVEEVNLEYFEENTVPPIMISVSNGRLTKESFETLERIFQENRGRDAQHRVVLIEAVTETVGLEEKSTASIQVDKLADARQSDGLFKAYDDSNISKVLSSFRIDPLLVGMGGSKTFASANVSMYVTESQVFQPDRADHDEFINMHFINHPSGLGLKTCKLESRGPTVTNPEQIIRMLTAINVMGGVTPRTAIDTINETMQLSLEQYPMPNEDGWEPWMDQPLQLSVRQVTQTSDDRQQQTGEGDTTHTGQSAKSKANKQTEASGNTGAETANNAQDKGQLPA